MRRLVIVTVCLGVLAGCTAGESHTRRSPPFRPLGVGFDDAWEAALQTLGERGYGLQTIDQDAGIIETSWRVINPEYESTVLLTSHDDRYSVCGKPALGQAYRVKEARVELVLHRHQNGRPRMRVEAFFRTQRYWCFPVRGTHPVGEMPCQSRGRLEDEILAEVQIRAVSDQLERYRRGRP